MLDLRSRHFHVAPLAALSLAAVSCSPHSDLEPTVSSLERPTIAHTFDFSSRMPSHLAVMFSMSWFGIPGSDPQGAGPDPSYGNSQWQGGCVGLNNPATCNTCVLYGAGDACLQQGAPQRDVASRRRMLAGPYSASARDTEGRRRVDLMLSTLRRPCDDGAKLDAWSVQLNGSYNTPLHPGNHQATTSVIAYDALLGFAEEADGAGIKNVILPGDDATFYFHFGTDVGLGKCDDSTGNPKQNCINALTQDLTDMASLAAAHPSAIALGGTPVLLLYVDPQYLTPGQWLTVLQNARNAAGRDFYVVAMLQNPTWTVGFEAFDALAPWVQLDWSATSGATVRAHAANYAGAMHAALYAALPNYPGREVFGGVAPGFDDWTEKWGACVERQLPPGDPRDPALLPGEFDYLVGQHTRGVVMQTWDDWTEGSEFEPDVAGGPSMLVNLRDNLGRLAGEPADPAGDARLSSRWENYGQARNCSGGPAGTPPQTDLTCPSGGDGGNGSCSEGLSQASNGAVGGWNTANVDLLMDVNGDKKDDLVILWNNGGATTAQVTLSNGTGFTQASNASVGVWDVTSQNLVADVNGDGKKDLLRVYASGTNAVADVWLSNGTGFASASQATVGGWNTANIDLALDVDGDGKDDLVILWNNAGATTAQVNLSNGSGFTWTSNDALGAAWNAADRYLVADVNGDGKKDLVRFAANGTEATAQVFLSQGKSFSSASNATIGGWNSEWQFLVGDVNGDGKDDFVTLWNNGGQVWAQLDLSNGTGFSQASNASLGVPWSTSNRAWLADVTGDGKKDLVLVYPSGSEQVALIAASTGDAFSPGSTSSLGGYAATWVDLTGDVDGDGRQDLVVLWQDTTQPANASARGEVNLSRCE